MADLKDKIVLVTGAAGAIGAAVTAAVKRAGGVAIATDLAGGAGIDAALDVTAEADWQRVTTEVERQHGRLDGLVNAAGIAALLRKKGGSIVNLSSVSGLVGGHNLAAYNASKGGLSLLTKSVALTGARRKPPVRCNAVCPAFLEGPMVEQIAQATRYPDAVHQRLVMDIPLGRLGKPAEVADFCVYLLSDAAAFITGADLPIDGGLTAR